MTRHQRAEFVDVAKKVAGLSGAQLAAAHKDPATLAAVPVRTDVLPVETEPVARTQEEGEESFSWVRHFVLSDR